MLYRQAYKIAFKTPLGTTPCYLVYGKACHLPIKLEHRAYWAIKSVNIDLKAINRRRKFQLNEFDEWWMVAYDNMRIYKDKIKKYHDMSIHHSKQFKEGDQVLLFIS